jgi:hypothetical protein
MTTHSDNIVIELCQEGMKEEEGGYHKKAKELYDHAWEMSSTPYEKCIAAHYLARQHTSAKALDWNLEALRQAEQTTHEYVRLFYPSLYICIALSYEDLEDYDNAWIYVNLASDSVSILHDDDYGTEIREWIEQACKRLKNR